MKQEEATALKRREGSLRQRLVFLSAVALTIFFSAHALAAADEEKVVNVYGWSDYIGPDTLAGFTARTGIKVNYDVYDSNRSLGGETDRRPVRL